MSRERVEQDVGDHITINAAYLDATKPGVWEMLERVGILYHIPPELQDAILGWVRNWKQFGDPAKDPCDEGGWGTGKLTGELDLRLLVEMARLNQLSDAPYGPVSLTANYGDAFSFQVKLSTKGNYTAATVYSQSSGTEDAPVIELEINAWDEDGYVGHPLFVQYFTEFGLRVPTPADATGKRNSIYLESSDPKIGRVGVSFDCW